MKTRRRVLVDIEPLRRSREYRLLWFGTLVSEAGHQVALVAVFFQVFHLTNSAAAVGLVGAVQIVPLVVTSIFGGPLIDRYDRRKLLVLTQCAFVLSSGTLFLAAASGKPPLWLIYGAIAVAAGISGLASPTRAALVPNLVPAEHLPSAIALNQLMWNATMVAGPAIGGFVIAKLGLQWAYLFDVCTYGVAIVTAIAMSPAPPHVEEGVTRTSGLAAVRESFAFLKGKRALRSTFTIDLVAMIFGMPRALFPILIVTRFDRGPEALGFLYSAIGAGALIGAATAGWVVHVRRQGMAVIFAVAAWGAGIVAFGYSRNLTVAILLLALAGAADVISAVFRSTILQTLVPDSLRGRLNAVHILVVTGGPRIGDIESGLVAEAFGTTFSVVSGGVAVLAGVAIIALFVPEFRNYRSAPAAVMPEEPPPAS